MTVITRIELAKLTDGELAALFGRIARALSDAKTGSVEWHHLRISLENIRQEQARRQMAFRPRPKPRGPGF